MNLMKLCVASLRFRALSNSFNVLVLALGVALVVMILQVSGQIERRFSADLGGIDLVVGAKGSPLQLILSSVFHLDIPTGNIPLEEAQKLQKNPLIKSAIPLALGDSYRSFRIVGSTLDYPEHYHAGLAQGQFWSQPMQAVFGAEAARVTGVRLGESFAGTHGLTEGGDVHEATPYTVTGILAPTGTVMDRLIITDMASVWEVHAHHHHHEEGHDADHHDDDADEQEGAKEITALLISYKTPLAVATLPRLINATTSLQAASPAYEMGHVLRLLGVGSDVLRMFAFAFIAIAGVGSFIALLGTVNDRRYDMALLRTLGMTRLRVFMFVILQGLALGGMGSLLGLVLGRMFSEFAALWLSSTRHVVLAPLALPAYEGFIVLAALGLSMLAAIIPATMAYRMNIASVLAKRN